jgi:NAD(P) transhydrogenase subunit alpha
MAIAEFFSTLPIMASVADKAQDVAEKAQALSQAAEALAAEATQAATAAAAVITQNAGGHSGGEFWYLFTIFVLAVFVGFYVVWSVTPALHSPLMGVTNAISSVIIVGAILAVGPLETTWAKVLGFVAVMLASVNIFGGFIVTQRMLHMFKKKGQ